MKPSLLFILTAFLCSYSSAQETDPYKILDEVIRKSQTIHDYQADVEIEVDVDFIRMPVKHATAYYKQPDKVRFKSDEFIMLPKKGFDFSVQKLLKEDYTAVFSGVDTIDRKKNDVIQVIPLKHKSDIVLSTLWVEQGTSRITKAESTTRSKGSYTLDFIYAKPEDILSSVMKISFEMENFKIPIKFIGKNVEVDEEKMKDQTVKTGAVYIRFSNYKINQGLEDKVFQEPEN
jgi:outer membrane lipoprotein-sorting protein